MRSAYSISLLNASRKNVLIPMTRRDQRGITVAETLIPLNIVAVGAGFFWFN